MCPGGQRAGRAHLQLFPGESAGRFDGVTRTSVADRKDLE
jgi:hypothetical protein